MSKNIPSHAVRAGDAIIIATAVEHHLPLATANTKLSARSMNWI